MPIFNMHQAKTNLSKVVETALSGERVFLARAGKPVAEIVALDSVRAGPPRIGFMAGRIEVPEDIDTFASKEIDLLFRGRI